MCAFTETIELKQFKMLMRGTWGLASSTGALALGLPKLFFLFKILILFLSRIIFYIIIIFTVHRKQTKCTYKTLNYIYFKIISCAFTETQNQCIIIQEKEIIHIPFGKCQIYYIFTVWQYAYNLQTINIFNQEFLEEILEDR